MKYRITPFISATLIAFGLLCATSMQANAMPESFADLAANQRPSVVNISTTKKVAQRMPQNIPNLGHGSPFEQFFQNFLGQQMPQKETHALGTGFIISSEGFVVTNNHVVEGADEIIVKTSDGEEHPAELIGADAKLDVAVLKIKGAKLKAVHLGNSDKLRVGDWVVAIGNPFGLEQTVTAGIVSARGRVIGSGPYDDFIQTDAAINPGNSGGPLFNRRGEVIGINTAIYTRSGGNNGIGFAIPINLAKSAFDQLRKSGHVQRGRIGVFIRDVDKQTQQALGLKNSHGALIPQVEAGSAADKAGIQAGDVIVAVDGEAIKSAHDLPIRIARHHPGDHVMLDVMRGSKQLHIAVTVEEMHGDDAGSKGNSPQHQKEVTMLGLVLEVADAASMRKLGARVDGGLLVKRVLHGSPAQANDIKAGDVLYKVNGIAVRNVSTFRKILNNLEAGQVLRIMMDRHGNQAFRILRPAQPKK
ncbi:MAG: Do family serine endopeptidase [Mariprofundaceae bacterium]|nr:Do family serine endopeptidase [Mariprofundaceae bacterium]